MSVTNVTREELWAKQHLSCKNMDYAVWAAAVALPSSNDRL